MTLQINLTATHASAVSADLLAIAGADAPKVSINSAGDVRFLSAPNTDFVGGTMIAALFDAGDLRVTIHAVDGASSVIVVPKQGGGTTTQPHCSAGIFWQPPAKRGIGPPLTAVDVDVAYDPNDVGGPYVGYSASGAEIPAPSILLLVFGLAAALHWWNTSYSDTRDPSTIPIDPDACLTVENQRRRESGLIERAGPLEIFGKACPVKPRKRSTQPPKATSGGKYYRLPCFVATAAYGSSLADEVELLRRFRDDVLTQTRGGEEFFERFHERYYRISPPIAAHMEEDPELSELMRQAIVEPLVQWLRLALEMPDAPLDDVPAPWSDFLEGLQETLESWAREVALRDSFEGIEGIAAVRELGIILRYALRNPRSRADYLDDLESKGAIPLGIEPHEVEAARAILSESGRDEDEIRRLVGPHPASAEGGAR